MLMLLMRRELGFVWGLYKRGPYTLVVVSELPTILFNS